ncbi:hypothetical protein HU200_020115 [Digitaria exilis]|uniref:TF-B3 domain-containing protein n=1 Tax=Digitaria exilis TaxID=1010633 RepID=A0A835F1D2_9POAL|nr:hypothetical protein HU200_020115 [Digitaria exilis]
MEEIQAYSSSKRIEEDNDEEMNDAVVDDGGGGDTSGRDGLLFTLVQRLQVCRPALVLRKPLVRSYLNRQQNYLGITQAEYDRGFRRPGMLTGDEHDGVRCPGGLPLRALDRRGVSYSMVLVRLKKTYRLRAGWGRFLRNAGVRQDDDAHVGDVVEVWAFRSPAWGDGLGLVLLHYTKEEEAEIMAPPAMSSSAGYRHRLQGRQLAALPSSSSSVLTEEEEEEVNAVSAAVTLVSMKRD